KTGDEPSQTPSECPNPGAKSAHFGRHGSCGTAAPAVQPLPFPFPIIRSLGGETHAAQPRASGVRGFRLLEDQVSFGYGPLLPLCSFVSSVVRFLPFNSGNSGDFGNLAIPLNSLSTALYLRLIPD